MLSSDHKVQKTHHVSQVRYYSLYLPYAGITPIRFMGQALQSPFSAHNMSSPNSLFSFIWLTLTYPVLILYAIHSICHYSVALNYQQNKSYLAIATGKPAFSSVTSITPQISGNGYPS